MTQVLQFSGGKDSLACLYLLRPIWKDLIVAWVNTGASFPETLAQMELIRALVPNFHEIKSRQYLEFGWPADLLPARRSAVGVLTYGEGGEPWQSTLQCCARSIWIPLGQAMQELGATVVYQGTRNDDTAKAPVHPGDVHHGMRFEFPVWDWTQAQVFAYLTAQGVELPPGYRYTHGGLDCWNCTGYLYEVENRFDFARDHHPQKYVQIMAKLRDLRRWAARDMAHLDETLACS